VLDLNEMKKVWNVTDNLQSFVSESKAVLWSEMNTDDLDEGIYICIFICVYEYVYVCMYMSYGVK
jgi:hypothetical protein